jgi:hypothetical protein
VRRLAAGEPDLGDADAGLAPVKVCSHRDVITVRSILSAAPKPPTVDRRTQPGGMGVRE